jgi:hypothetical protein
MPIPAASRSRAWVCGCSLDGDCGFESHRGHGCLSLMNVVCCEVVVSASGRSLVQRSPTECGRETPIMRTPWPTGGCCAAGGKNVINLTCTKLTSPYVLSCASKYTKET